MKKHMEASTVMVQTRISIDNQTLLISMDHQDGITSISFKMADGPEYYKVNSCRFAAEPGDVIQAFKSALDGLAHEHTPATGSKVAMGHQSIKPSPI